MKNKIAILLPYKEKYNINKAGAASIWVKDYLSISKLKKHTTVYGNLLNKDKPLTKNYFNIDLTNKILMKNIAYLLIFLKRQIRGAFASRSPLPLI